MFDKDKLEKILFNLLSNAFKFTPPQGKVEVSLSLMDKNEEQTKWLAIRVKDTGIGIPPEKQERIFERFFQHDVPASLVNQGSGIGLSITKEFVKLHGGIITVESEVDAGSCFAVLIPLVDILADVKVDASAS
jgi:signal transduction histidine kinase